MKRNLLFVILSFLSLNALGQTDIKFDPQAASEAVKRGGSENSSFILVMPHNFEDNSYSYIGQCDNPRKVMFNNAKEWVAKNFGDYNRVVKLDDADNYKLIIKAKLPERRDLDTENTNPDKLQLTYLNSQAEFTLTIEARDGRYRLLIEDMAVNCRVEKEVRLRKTMGSSRLIPMSVFCTSYKTFASFIKYDLERLLESAKSAIEKRKVEDDW